MKDFRHKCELRLLVCEPNPFRPDRVTVGFILRDTSAEDPRVEVRLARDLRAIQCVYPEADLEAIESALLEMKPILANVTDFEQYLHNMPAETPADFTFLPGSAILTNSMDDEVALLTEQYLVRTSLPANEGKQRAHSTKRETGRPYLLGRMKAAFDAYGLMDELQKEIDVSEYTFKGNPLKIDFGYRDRRNDAYVMMQAVSVVSNLERAMTLALSWSRIQKGFRAKGTPNCEMFGIVEDLKFHESENSQAAMTFMIGEGMKVRSVASMANVAAEAASALRA